MVQLDIYDKVEVNNIFSLTRHCQWILHRFDAENALPSEVLQEKR